MAKMLKLPYKKRQMVLSRVDELVEKTDMTAYRSMKKKLVATFGEENVQIGKLDEEAIHARLRNMGYNDTNVTQVDDTSFGVNIKRVTLAYHIVIRIPEFTIKNSRGNSTVIRDMFIRLQVLPDGRLAHGGLEGLVATFTKAQARTGYMHSHLIPAQPGLGRVPSFCGFCLGQGHINQVIALLQAKYNEVNFQMLCLHIKNFLEWESLEGVPHYRMADVREPVVNSSSAANTVNTITASLISEILRKEFYKLAPEISRALITISPNTYEMYVEPTEGLEMWVADVILAKQHDILRMNIPVEQLLAVKDNAGNYLRYIQDGSSTLNVSKDTVLQFRGEDIKIKIVDNEQNLKSTKYGNPKITEHLCWRLSADLTRTATEYTYARSKDTSQDQREPADANHDAVREAATS
jgi:hypothetical protein